MKIEIRQEQSSDYAIIESVVKLAFETAPHTDGDEHNLVARLRKSAAFIPELSLVAVMDDKIIGHIMYTKATVNNNTVLTLAPVSVSPEYQKMGIGSRLINEGDKIALSMDFDIIVVLGDNNYYSKFGFEKAENFDISAPFDVPSEYFMAKSLQNNKIKLGGTITYPKEFGI